MLAILYIRRNIHIFSPLQVKNKLHDGVPEHVFILGSMDFTVVGG
jgi:hypothetical protein